MKMRLFLSLPLNSDFMQAIRTVKHLRADVRDVSQIRHLAHHDDRTRDYDRQTVRWLPLRVSSVGLFRLRGSPR